MDRNPCGVSDCTIWPTAGYAAGSSTYYIISFLFNRRKQQQLIDRPTTSQSHAVVQLDGPYGNTATIVINHAKTKDTHVYEGVNGDATKQQDDDGGQYQEVLVFNLEWVFNTYTWGWK